MHNFILIYFHRTILSNSILTNSILILYPSHSLVTACDAGFFGEDCKERCSCSNGATCDHRTGTCVCAAGWRGRNCDKGTNSNRVATHMENREKSGGKYL